MIPIWRQNRKYQKDTEKNILVDPLCNVLVHKKILSGSKMVFGDGTDLREWVDLLDPNCDSLWYLDPHLP